MVALIGAFLLLDTLDIIVFNFAVVWPLLLIAFGLSVLVRALERNRFRVGAAVLDFSRGGHACIFSDYKSGSDTQDFHGGDATAIFGAARFDLRNASMTVDEARIDVNVVFGEAEVRVPETWSVINRAALFSRALTTKPFTPKRIPTSRLRVW